MSSRSNHNHRQQNANKPQMRFVPKTHNPPKQEPSLTTSLRQTNTNTSSTSSSSSSSRVRIGDNGNWISNNQNQGSTGGNFVNYLPQDEAVATGLVAEDGALDAVESQRVVDLLNRELSHLLKLNPRDFWKQVASDTSLHNFLDSYLQFRKRWYDFPHHGAKGLVAGVIVGELELSRRVFMVLYRISSNRDPGARASDSLSAKEHGAVLQDKKLLDLPKLLDICAIYCHENEELTRSLVTNSMQAQPMLHENLSAAVSRFLSVVQTMHQRCDSLLKTLHSPGGRDDRGDGQLSVDFLEVMDFINDAVASLDAFVKAYKPAALYFLCPVEMSYGSGELLGTLARLHDSLLPSLQKGIEESTTTENGTKNTGVGAHADTATSFKILSMRIINFFWRLLELCYLSDEVFKGSLPYLTPAKMFPSNVEDPVIRGDILVQTFKDINEEVSHHGSGNMTGTLLQKVQHNYKILSRLEELRDSGWLFMDSNQFQYVTIILVPPFEVMRNNLNVSSSKGNKLQMDENAAITESKISQIKELFPEYGKGFLAACLEVYNHNPEEVIQRILEGTLHEDLQSMDISLDKVPPPKPAPTLNRKDKGKALVQSTSPSEVVATAVERQAEGNSSSSSSSHLVGRYTRKNQVDLANPQTLDSRRDEDNTKTSALASQYEYEDEYDDSFDDLGLSVVESGYEDTENKGERIKSAPGKSGGVETESTTSSKSGPKWNSRKTPQFYVKDGKNYSYKVSGSVAVADSREAALFNQTQRDTIHGLGRGGNLPLGNVKPSWEYNEEQDQALDGTETGGRGGAVRDQALDGTETRGRGGAVRSRGRGRRGGFNSAPRSSEDQAQPSNGPERGGRGISDGSRGRGRRGAVNSASQSTEEQDEVSDGAEVGWRGSQDGLRGRGRRGGGGGRNHNRKAQSIKKHFAGLGGF